MIPVFSSSRSTRIMFVLILGLSSRRIQGVERGQDMDHTQLYCEYKAKNSALETIFCRVHNSAFSEQSVPCFVHNWVVLLSPPWERAGQRSKNPLWWCSVLDTSHIVLYHQTIEMLFGKFVPQEGTNRHTDRYGIHIRTRGGIYGQIYPFV